MSEANFASLSPTLLARKGGARPAMRPQLGPIANNAAPNLEDLGWNDMGDNDDAPPGAEIIHLTPSPAKPDGERETCVGDREAETALTRGAMQRKAAGEQMAEAGCRLRAVTLGNSRHAAARQGRRAAFTLRLDPERHLKLRLASTIRNRSAQQLLTEALDRMLGEMPDLDALAAQVKRS